MKIFNKKGLSLIELLVALSLISLVLVFLMVLLANISSEKSGISTDRVEAMLNQSEIVKDIQEKLAGENVYGISYFYDNPNKDTVFPVTGSLKENFTNKTLIVINYRNSLFQNGFVLIAVSPYEIAVNKFDNTSIDELKNSFNNLFNDRNKTTWHSTFDKDVASYDYTQISMYTYNTTKTEKLFGFDREVTSSSFAKIRIPYTFVNEEFYDRSYDIEITLYNEDDKITINKLWSSDDLDKINAEAVEPSTLNAVQEYLLNGHGYNVSIANSCPNDISKDDDDTNTDSSNICLNGNTLYINLDCKYENNICPWSNIRQNIQSELIKNEILTRIAPKLSTVNIAYNINEFEVEDIKNVVMNYFNRWTKTLDSDTNIHVEIQNNKVSVVILVSDNDFVKWWYDGIGGISRTIHKLGVQNKIRDVTGLFSIISFSVQKNNEINGNLTGAQTRAIENAFASKGYVISVSGTIKDSVKFVNVGVDCNASTASCPRGLISKTSFEADIRSELPNSWYFAILDITYKNE